MTKQDILQIKELLSTPKKVVIVPHKNPDGDAMGSSLGLYKYLKQLGHEATVIAPNEYPLFLKWLPNEASVLKYDTHLEMSNTLINDADILFTLDYNALHRTGNMATALEASKAIKIMIDHHQQPDDYARYMYSDTSICSTCQMMYHFFEMLDATDAIDAEIATCLYTGIMTDTGSFRFRSTTSTTHRVIADLIDRGADNTEIHNSIYDTNSFNRMQLLGTALNNLKVVEDLNTVYISLSQKELNRYDYKKGDTEGFVNYGLSLNNIKFAVIFIENQQEGIIKISSMRLQENILMVVVTQMPLEVVARPL